VDFGRTEFGRITLEPDFGRTEFDRILFEANQTLLERALVEYFFCSDLSYLSTSTYHINFKHENLLGDEMTRDEMTKDKMTRRRNNRNNSKTIQFSFFIF
jgi:hypothetical protein